MSRIEMSSLHRIKGSKNLFKVIENLGDGNYKIYVFYKKVEMVVTEEQILSGDISDELTNDRMDSGYHVKSEKKIKSKSSWNPPVRIDNFTTVIFLDASTENTGYTVIEDGEIVKFGSLPSISSKSKEHRIDQMKRGLTSLLSEFSETKIIFIEDIYYDNKIDVFLALAELRGVLWNVAFNHDVHFSPLNTSTYRKPYGLANINRDSVKEAVQRLVRSRGFVFKNEDEADSLMMAIFILDYYLRD